MGVFGMNQETQEWMRLAKTPQTRERMVPDRWHRPVRGLLLAIRAIRFRHNTCDPDNLHDVLFGGWTDDTKDGQR